ncbi:MAG: hypothetical protein GF347_01185 [Candidatus Moranbacteria bacterium]|nr:hypothetical protein [Candidatus Moranbacteria bacterium]
MSNREKGGGNGFNIEIERQGGQEMTPEELREGILKWLVNEGWEAFQKTEFANNLARELERLMGEVYDLDEDSIRAELASLEEEEIREATVDLLLAVALNAFLETKFAERLATELYKKMQRPDLEEERESSREELKKVDGNKEKGGGLTEEKPGKDLEKKFQEFKKQAAEMSIREPYSLAGIRAKLEEATEYEDISEQDVAKWKGVCGFEVGAVIDFTKLSPQSRKELLEELRSNQDMLSDDLVRSMKTKALEYLNSKLENDSSDRELDQLRSFIFKLDSIKLDRKSENAMRLSKIYLGSLSKKDLKIYPYLKVKSEDKLFEMFGDQSVDGAVLIQSILDFDSGGMHREQFDKIKDLIYPAILDYNGSLRKLLEDGSGQEGKKVDAYEKKFKLLAKSIDELNDDRKISDEGFTLFRRRLDDYLKFVEGLINESYNGDELQFRIDLLRKRLEMQKQNA